MTKLDDTDREILSILRADARTPVAVLAQRLRIARGTAQARLRKLDMKLAVTDDALKLVAEEGFDPVFGARPLKRVMAVGAVSPRPEMLKATPPAADSFTLCTLPSVRHQATFWPRRSVPLITRHSASRPR